MDIHIDGKTTKQRDSQSQDSLNLDSLATKQYKAWVDPQNDREKNYGFRSVLDEQSPECTDLGELKKIVQARQQGSTQKPFKSFVVLGIGGSSLGAETLIRGLCSVNHPVQFFFMDNGDPAWLADHLQHWNMETTLFYVVSKSGTTLETWSQFLTVMDHLKAQLPAQLPKDSNNWQKHFVFCSGPQKGALRSFANKEAIPCFTIPASIGGRFSVFTPAGLFPALFAGLNCEEILLGAKELLAWESLDTNPALEVAKIFFQEQARNTFVCFSYSSYFQSFGRWLSQLWAESLGKDGKGFTPYSAIGTTDQHSQMQLYMDGPKDKIFAFIHIKNHNVCLPVVSKKNEKKLEAVEVLQGHSVETLFGASFLANQKAISSQGIPNFTITLDRLDEKNMGALLYFWQWVTVYTAALLEVNPFDQPGVEKSKVLLREYLSNKKTRT